MQLPLNLWYFLSGYLSIYSCLYFLIIRYSFLATKNMRKMGLAPEILRITTFFLPSFIGWKYGSRGVINLRGGDIGQARLISISHNLDSVSWITQNREKWL